MTPRDLTGHLGRAAEVAAAIADIDNTLALVTGRVSATSAKALVGLAGKGTRVADVALGPESYAA